MGYDRLRTLSLRFNSEADGNELPYRFYTLAFPTKWKHLMLEALAQAYNQPKDKVSIPIDNLNAGLRALVPDIISVAADAGRLDKTDWLLNSDQLPVDKLFLIVQAWLRTCFPKLSDEQRNHLLSELKADDLGWEEKVINLVPPSVNKPKVS